MANMSVTFDFSGKSQLAKAKADHQSEVTPENIKMMGTYNEEGVHMDCDLRLDIGHYEQKKMSTMYYEVPRQEKIQAKNQAKKESLKTRERRYSAAGQDVDHPK